MSSDHGCSSSNSYSGGIGFTGLLTVLFIGLKLMTHYITWSWWWVLSPIWIAAFLAAALLVLFLVVVAIVALAGG